MEYFWTVLASFIVLLMTAPQSYGAASDFSYDDNDENGPSNWANGTYCGSTKRQSPINIELNQVVSQNFTLDYSCNERKQYGYLVNNGHSPTFVLSESVCTLNVADVPGLDDPESYRLSSFHFHFGHDDQTGSEHTLNGKSFPSEVHFVHVNNKYPTTAEALNHPDGLAVIGVFLETNKRKNGELSKLIGKMGNIQNADARVDTSVKVMKLLPPLTKMFTYEGSLTTPPCNEAVQWFVAEAFLPVTENQLAVLRGLRSGGECSEPISKHGNDRQTQAMSGRLLYANF